MSFDPKNFRFSAKELLLDEAEFKAFLKKTYGKKYKVKELNQVVQLHYGKAESLDE